MGHEASLVYRIAELADHEQLHARKLRLQP
jgi:hypothetical protein